MNVRHSTRIVAGRAAKSPELACISREFAFETFLGVLGQAGRWPHTVRGSVLVRHVSPDFSQNPHAGVILRSPGLIGTTENLHFPLRSGDAKVFCFPQKKERTPADPSVAAAAEGPPILMAGSG
jgi:hypothetical protein